MPRSNDIRIRSGTTVPSSGDFSVGEPAWDKSAGRLYVKNAAGSMVEVGGGSSLSVHASVSAFPATGSSTVLYLSESDSRIFQWESPYYVEIGVSGGGGGGSSGSSYGSNILFG